MPAESGLNDAITSLSLNSQKGIAVAINNEVIPKADWEGYKLSEGDKIMLIQATQGG